MPSAANGKSEKQASAEAMDNSPLRQMMTIIEHKIRNLEKRKSKLTSYRDLQKAGKELNADQKVAVAKYDEVNQTLEFARDLSKQMSSIATAAEREAKKQAKKEAWVRYTAETGKIREVLLILDCLNQMGSAEARDDFLNGSNGAVKLNEEDLKILDDLYPEVTPKHEVNEEGLPGFYGQVTKAADHLYAIIDGKPKDVLGTTYTHIKQIVTSVHECGYFDRTAEPEPEEEAQPAGGEEGAPAEPSEAYVGVPPAPLPAAVPAPAYPLRPLPPITLQEVEHAYFAHQYPQQRPIAEVIGSQNFFFLQDSELDSPVPTPQPPPPPLAQPSPPNAIPTQTFTNQHFVAPPMPHPPHFVPHPDHAAYAAAPPPMPLEQPAPAALPAAAPIPPRADDPPAEPEPTAPQADHWHEGESPERGDDADRHKAQGQGDGQGRYRRYGRGGARPPSNGYRGRGQYHAHQRHNDYQARPNQGRQYGDQYQGGRHKDGYYGNGDAATGNGHASAESNGRDRDRDREQRYGDSQSYGGGFKGRGRGRAARPPRPHFARAKDPAD